MNAVTERDVTKALMDMTDDEDGGFDLGVPVPRPDLPGMLDWATVVSARTFEEAGVMTSNAGFVLKTSDGSEFQVTVVNSTRS